MKTITLRDISKPIADIIQETAKRNRTSLNKTVIGLLAQAVQPTKRKQIVYHDLDHLFGTWTTEEADAFDAELKAQRVIDKELWE